MDVNFGDARTTVVGFGGALTVLLILVYLVGIGDVVTALVMADRVVLLSVLVVAFAWLTAWSQALRTVLAILNVSASSPKAFLIYASSTFANNVTPFGQAGGEPFSALIISRATDSEYERGLAAIASVDALNFIPSILLALAGSAYYITQFSDVRRIEYAALSALMLAFLIPVTMYIGWQRRYALQSIAIKLFLPLAHAASRVIPTVSRPDPSGMKGRIEGFYHAIERVARSRRGLLAAVMFSTIGWILLATSLWLSLYALGHPVSPAVVLFVIPIGSIAGVTPLPGGLGGVETVIVLMLVPTANVDPAVASAAALIHRGATYWLPVLVGGGAVAFLEAENARR